MLCYSLRDNRTSTIQDNSFLLHGFYFDSNILIIIFVSPYWYLKSMLQKTTTDIPCIIALCKYCKFVAILLCQKTVSIFDSNKVFLFIFCNARDPHSIPGLGRSPGGGHGNPLQYFCLGNSMDRGALQSTYNPWGHKEWNPTLQLSHTKYF